jgi:hypothetical protein
MEHICSKYLFKAKMFTVQPWPHDYVKPISNIFVIYKRSHWLDELFIHFFNKRNWMTTMRSRVRITKKVFVFGSRIYLYIAVESKYFINLGRLSAIDAWLKFWIIEIINRTSLQYLKTIKKKIKMCRLSARRLSIHNFVWGLLKATKKVCLVLQKWKEGKNSYGGYPTEFAGST